MERKGKLCVNQGKLEEYVKQLGLKIKKQFGPAACLVFLVIDKKGKKSIIKLVNKNNPWKWKSRMVLDHIIWEKIILDKVKNVRGITHKLHFYDEKIKGERYVALLKEYVG